MKRLTIPCLVSFIAMLAFVGTSQAAANTIDDLFDTVMDTRTMILVTDGELVKIENQTEVMFNYVDKLYGALKTGADPDEIRSELDVVGAKLAAVKVRFTECRTELRVCDRMLDAALFEAEQWAAKGHYRAPKLLRLIKLCYEDLYVSQSRCGECTEGLVELRAHIEGLYALLP